MLLASPDEIRLSLGADDQTDTMNAIRATLHSAEAYLEARLNSNFTREIGVYDTFFLEESVYSRPGLGRTELRLSHGFVQGTPVVAYTFDPSDFAGATVLETWTSQAAELERGILKDYQTIYSMNSGLNQSVDYSARLAPGGFVRVTYTKGFEVDVSETTSYDLSQVPKWLQEAAKCSALGSMSGHPVFKDSGIKLDSESIRQNLEYILSTHVRYAPNALLPL